MLASQLRRWAGCREQLASCDGRNGVVPSTQPVGTESSLWEAQPEITPPSRSCDRSARRCGGRRGRFKKPRLDVLEVCDVAVDYDGAFAEVIVSRWSETPDEQRNAAESSDRQGQLAPDAPGSYALCDCFHYQRGHADVFREVYKKSRCSPPSKDERLLVVDIGAGAATVAVGLGEALKRSQRQRVDYRAFDPNPMMQEIGREILGHLGADFGSADYIESLDDVDFTDVDRLLFTFSYVAHQDTVAPAHIDSWASIIKRAVGEVDRAVEVIYTTANLDGGALADLERMLKEANVVNKQHRIDVQVRRRFPDSTRGDGPIGWDEQPHRWKVRAEHWILRT